MLTDAQVDRYGRQILAPDVGGRGQERLLASRVAVTGVGPAAERARDLVARAGVTLTDHLPDLVLAFDGVRPVTARSIVAGHVADQLAVVARTRHACAACSGTTPDPVRDDIDPSSAAALGAIAAGEALRLLLDDLAPPRRTVFDARQARGTATLAGCPACGQGGQNPRRPVV